MNIEVQIDSNCPEALRTTHTYAFALASEVSAKMNGDEYSAEMFRRVREAAEYFCKGRFDMVGDTYNLSTLLNDFLCYSFSNVINPNEKQKLFFPADPRKKITQCMCYAEDVGYDVEVKEFIETIWKKFPDLDYKFKCNLEHDNIGMPKFIIKIVEKQNV